MFRPSADDSLQRRYWIFSEKVVDSREGGGGRF